MQAETKRWIESRGKRRGQSDGPASPSAASRSPAPSSPSTELLAKSPGGQLNLGAAEARLAALLHVFEIREAEAKEHGHAVCKVPSAELVDVLQCIGVSCSSGELEAMCAQLQHIAGRIGAHEISALIVDTACRIVQRPHMKRSTHAAAPSPPQAKANALSRHASAASAPSEETSTPKSPATPASKGGTGRREATPATPSQQDVTAYPSIDVQLLAMGVRRQQMLNHIMDGTDKGPERRAKVTLSTPLDTPKPPPLTQPSEIALSEVIRDVLKRVDASSSMQKSSSGAGKATMTLFRVPSATARHV